VANTDRGGDPQEDRDVVLCFTYTPVFTVSLILVVESKNEVESERE